MNDVELSLIPVEARPYQGTAAGIVTRVAANTIDAAVVGMALAGTYVGVVAFLFVVSPRDFSLPDPSLVWFVIGYFDLLVLYLTGAWWLSGRTLGDQVMGIRVVTGKRSRLRFLRAFARAMLCACFPVGLMWCAVNRERRAVHDLVLRTSVVYDWLPRPRPAAPPSGLHPGGMRTRGGPRGSMGHRPRREEFLMADADQVPWGLLAAAAAGVVALAVVVRGVTAVVRIALGEARYRASDPDAWLKWIK